MRISTWNVNSLKVRLDHLLAVLERYQPDVLALQETKMTDDVFPAEAIQAAGYDVIYTGQKTYNGVALLSKQKPESAIYHMPGRDDDPQKRFIAATYNNIHIINVYVPNGQSLDSDKYHYKLDWLQDCHAYCQQALKQYEHVVILGDFNIAPKDEDVHDPQAWEGHVLVSQKERDALNALLDLGLNDSFRLFEQAEKSYSWWDYRQMAFRRKRGLRIDLILVSDALKAKAKACVIEVEPRKWERPSDHTIVWLDL